ncbi:MAG: hypothetical protein CMM44_07705 [Rhodospirillaceae bacterium]|nr:hypothetical protein [Rhodospirillaceae bacterium]|tara:strand:- start:292 stop:1101 length:810 start_codon:yes stop_codon:yes gene_type:complete
MTKKIVIENFVLDGGLPIFLAKPETIRTNRPAVILVHERYGFVRHTKNLAKHLAKDGYVCAAPDCFFLAPNKQLLHEGRERYDIDDNEAFKYLSISLDFLKECKYVDNERIAVKGVCQTGRFPLVLASRRKIAAALLWYGSAQEQQWEQNKLFPKPLDRLIGEIDCPVLGMFGEADHIISIDNVRRLRNSLERHKKSYQIHVYKNAPHGWLNDTMPGRYRQTTAEIALLDQKKFLNWVFSSERNHNDISWRFSCDSNRFYNFSKNLRQE